MIAGLILSSLGFVEPPLGNGWPHIWWIPTGTLCRFPLHAAGYHFTADSDTVLDRAMSSYSSSIKAIISARRASVLPPSIPTKALFVAREHRPGSSTLQFAPQEVATVRQLCASMNISHLEPRKCKNEILSGLQECGIFHFAGHGRTDENDPFTIQLMLEDGKRDSLTVTDLMNLKLRKQNPFLAYLSACGTGRLEDQVFSDESIHLIGACQMAGFRHVIATLWEVNDKLCVDMARIFYEGLRDGGMTDESVCLGLHKATRALRDRQLNTQAQGAEEREHMGTSSRYDKGHGCNEGHGATGKDRLPRHVLVEEEDDDEPLLWVPYVHFGV